MQLFKRFLIPIGLLALLIGCEATTPVKEQTGQIPTISEEELEQGLALTQAGNHRAAAAHYERLARQTAPPVQDDLLLYAAESHLQAENPAAAAQLLAQIEPNNLTPISDLRRRLVAAELAIDSNRFQEAQSLLIQPLAEETPIDLLKRYRETRARAFRLAGNLLESARDLSELDLLQEDPEARLLTQQGILQELTTLTDVALSMLQPEPPGIYGGWMELARIIKAYEGDTGSTRGHLNQWKERFPVHPVLPELLEGYFQRLQAQYKVPNHLAVLLPQSGPFAGAAGALRDGLLAAYYNTPADKRPQLRFYDSSNTTDTWPLYQEAIDAGAEMIIGPLSKEAVSQLARAGELSVPVLALNQVPPETTPPEDLYQFGLSPEDEAQQVAEQAWLDGHTRAVVLTPEGSWGDRIHESFRDRWESLGNTLLEHQTYNPKGQELSSPIRTLLNLDESDARHRRLRGILKTNFKFEPRRRQDVDFVFFAARPVSARQLRPLLQFHHAADLPVYTTSHAYTGAPDPVEDRDLEGLKFLDMPWLLTSDSENPLSRQQLTEQLPGIAPRYWRLYAMGIDSFRLLPHLGRLRSSPWETLDGHTGNLYLDQINQVHRRLVWAQMTQGRPKVMGYAPRIESGLTETDYELPELPIPRVMEAAPTTAPAALPAPQPTGSP
ncbi:penicillin-binding protein activator [Pseudomonadota bacterium]